LPALLQAGLVDELIVYIAPKLLGSDARGYACCRGLKTGRCPHFKFNEIRQVARSLPAFSHNLPAGIFIRMRRGAACLGKRPSTGAANAVKDEVYKLL
jgi:hypothetical protein